ncbi:NAD(P)-dependent dehydrogenase, short-chain alcohol dehydrogenase family [Candidatus Kryptonium thompsonii]|uniref:NAD(P)-dependent dehydrogenase, short-chain alcohol dehydrogenase family n=2 Tax=Candidatus Kryptonium thompsonii TaxID=1633631 RepID=A0A0P1M6A6_9BACT|nr:SDR family oxidoreductase [Candidatus Kryptonium thompsoni]CUS77507.1 NAD(P)-dependent dehydrogenase, short-chain alcohol dehydrogenase family [Candidatus Kryptonium thompsoni]CUS78136.1 NAD(P)-dependent dehydrogenase, short-chain alcohol dehydrogenase family [Candidatus Kryptonium thompsoni]CUS80993.1 NAD(P)-dependent dehydrogenase, short-chain alcohol dehydrogenase family [Candidatus Kryptonium thompsoni]CUS82070.1 NAD(P)-dependent dehydrogenase, short-chain alcohol dehydrogenase family [C
MFNDKNVVVTGSTGGLGSVVVRHFLDNGARVYAVYRSGKKFKGVFKDVLKNKNLYGVKANLLKEGDVEKIFKFVRRHGGVDFLINCVGGYFEGKMIFELKESEFDEMIDLNLRSAFLCSKWALRDMILKRNGRIVNISSTLALKPSPGKGAYIVSKAGLIALTEVIAEEVKDFNITCNVILPSVIATEENKKSMPGVDYSNWVDPYDLARFIGYLCSEEAKGINGAVIKFPGKV